MDDYSKIPKCPKCGSNVNIVSLLYNKFRCIYCGKVFMRKGQTSLQ